MIRRLQNQKGFTLIELIAVIAILGILALLIVPRVGNYNTSAKVSKAKADLTILKNAIERYNAEHDTPLTGTLVVPAGAYATTGDKLTKKTDSTGAAVGTLGPYVASIPSEWVLATPIDVAVLSAIDTSTVKEGTTTNVGKVVYLNGTTEVVIGQQ